MELVLCLDPNIPPDLGPYRHRLKPFQSGLGAILGGYPMGLVLGALNERYSRSNNSLADTWDRVRRKSIKVDDAFLDRLARLFVARNDEQHYHLFGDPGTHLRVPPTAD